MVGVFDTSGQYLDLGTKCSKVNEDTINGYINYLRQSTEATDVSINSYIKNIRPFLYFCMKKGYTDKFTISDYKYNKPIKETYTMQELEILLKKPNTKKCNFSEVSVNAAGA